MVKEENILKSPWVWGAAVVILIVLIFPKLASVSPGEYDSFASCLTDAGLVKYGTDWCPHCQNQKALFGSSFKKINYVNCDKDQNECLRNGVQGYPTWILNGESYSGVQPLEKLAEITGCELVKG